MSFGAISLLLDSRCLLRVPVLVAVAALRSQLAKVAISAVPYLLWVSQSGRGFHHSKCGPSKSLFSQKLFVLRKRRELGVEPRSGVLTTDTGRTWYPPVKPVVLRPGGRIEGTILGESWDFALASNLQFQSYKSGTRRCWTSCCSQVCMLYHLKGGFLLCGSYIYNQRRLWLVHLTRCPSLN